MGKKQKNNENLKLLGGIVLIVVVVGLFLNANQTSVSSEVASQSLGIQPSQSVSFFNFGKFICNTNYEPVCTTNGLIFPNKCTAKTAGLEIDESGKSCKDFQQVFR